MACISAHYCERFQYLCCLQNKEDEDCWSIYYLPDGRERQSVTNAPEVMIQQVTNILVNFRFIGFSKGAKMLK